MERIDNIAVPNYSDPRSESEIEADLRALTDSNPEINPEARSRAVRNIGDLLFNGSLSLNMAAIAEQIPIIIGKQKRDLRGHESEQSQYNLKVSYTDNTRIVRIREQNPGIYKTNLDVVREMFAIGKIIMESVRMSPEFRETEQYRYFDNLDHQDVIESLAGVAVDHIRKRAAFFLKDVIDRDQFIQDVNTVLNGCENPEVKALVQPIAERLMSEHGMEEEKDKMKEKDKKQRQRDKQKRYREKEKKSTGLRVVGGTDYEGDSDIDD
jgi:hypothetical protein